MTQSVFFFDTETTSADPTKARVVEIAVLYQSVSDADGILTPLEGRYRPPGDIEIGAQAVHHITPDMVADCELFETSLFAEQTLTNIIKTCVAVAHNAPYDIAVLHNEGIEITKYIDTLQVARHICKDDKPESYSLQYLRYFYKLDGAQGAGQTLEGSAHSAMYDTVVLSWLYALLFSMRKTKYPHWSDERIIDDFIRLSTTPVILTSLPFGKYKGVPLAQVRFSDYRYLEWLKRSEMEKPIEERNKDLIHSLVKLLNMS